MKVETDDDRGLHAYVDGQLDGARHAAVAARLASDPVARERVEAYAAQRGLLREGWDGMDDAPEDPRTVALTEELARRLGARRTETEVARLAGKRWRPRAVLLPAALAASVAVGWFAHDAWTPSPRTGGLVAVPPTSFAGVLQLPSLGELGMHFVGGNVTDTPEGVLAYLTYQDASGDRMNLTISPYPHEGGMRPVVTEREGVRQAYWTNARRSYVLTTTSRHVRVDAIAASLDPQRISRTP